MNSAQAFTTEAGSREGCDPMPSDQPLHQSLCPALAELAALRMGELPPERVAEIVLHLSNCSKCEATYQQGAADQESERETLEVRLKDTHSDPGQHHSGDTRTKMARKVEPAARPAPRMEAAVGLAPAQPQAAPAAPLRLGPYEVKERIGGGGMGTVYRAFHVKLKKWVALKVVRSDWLGDAQTVIRFQREMEAVGRLDHPNIVRATDAGEEGGVHYLVMEWVDGTDLANLVWFCGPLPVADACALIRQAAAALQCAHLQGLVHRDIKPSNLLLSKQGVLKLLDLGLARLVGQLDGSAEVTMHGQMMGTADYTAPEQWVSSHDVDIRADIYSLGCTLYNLLTGRPPFTGAEYDSPLKKMAAHLQITPLPVRRLRADVPEGLAVVLTRLLAKKPGERYSSPAEVEQALEPFAAQADLVRLAARPGLAASAETQGKPSAGVEASSDTSDASGQSRRHPRLWLLAGVAVLLAIGVAGLVGVLLSSTTPGREHEPEAAFAPGKSYELLEREPQKLFWPEDPKGSYWHYQGPHKPLMITCNELGLIHLANVRGNQFDLEVTFSQPSWNGGFGVFFAGREEGAGGKVRWSADTILLDKFSDTEANPEKTPLHHAVFVKRSEPAMKYLEYGNHQPVAYPRGLVSRLKITVDAKGLAQVSWNDEAIKQPTFYEAIPGTPHRDGADGAVGILVKSSNVAIHSARLSVHPSGNQP
jgi:eukaryotic-like serine/threonine-protein kinase